MFFLLQVVIVFFFSVLGGVQGQTQTNLPTNSYSGVSSDSSGSHLTAVVYGGPIYYSNDSGVSWKVSDAPNPGNYLSVAASSTGQYVIAASSSATLVSSNYAQHFTTAATIDGSSNSVAVSATGQYMVSISASATPKTCVAYSNNYGVSFTLNLGVNSTGTTCVGVGIDTSGSYVVLSVYPQGLWVTNNISHISSWQLTYETETKISAIGFGGTSFYAGYNSAPAYIIQSSDYGVSWTIKGNLPEQIKSISVDATGTYLLLASNNHLYFSENSGVSYIWLLYSSAIFYCAMNDNATFAIFTDGNSQQQLDVFIGDPLSMVAPVPTFAPASTSCSSSACPTSCPAGYIGGYWQFTGNDCKYYCQDQPTYSQCAPGGSGCTSTCSIGPAIIAGIVLGSFACCCILVCISIRWYFGRLLFCWPTKEPMATKEIYLSNA